MKIMYAVVMCAFLRVGSVFSADKAVRFQAPKTNREGVEELEAEYREGRRMLEEDQQSLQWREFEQQHANLMWWANVRHQTARVVVGVAWGAFLYAVYSAKDNQCED